jgi:ArsR family metal-binding transcriptional regulator
MKILFERVQLLKWYARDFTDARQTIDLSLDKNTLKLVIRISPEIKEILRLLMILDHRKNYSEIIRQLILKEGDRKRLIKKNNHDLVILTNLYDMRLLDEISEKLKDFRKLNRKYKRRGRNKHVTPDEDPRRGRIDFM